MDSWILYCSHEWLVKLCSKYLKVLANVTVRVYVTEGLYYFFLFCSSGKLVTVLAVYWLDATDRSFNDLDIKKGLNGRHTF